MGEALPIPIGLLCGVLTGQLSGYASGDRYVLSQIRQSSTYKNGLKTYKINIIVQDSQSSPTTAGTVALVTDSWWGPYIPTTSSLTGQTAKSHSDGYQAATGNQWVRSIGSTYSLFEVAREAFRAVSDPHDAAEVANALHLVNYTGTCGALNFANGPAPGVAIINLERMAGHNSLDQREANRTVSSAGYPV